MSPGCTPRSVRSRNTSWWTGSSTSSGRTC
jgi:hypothetical protein